MCRVSAHLAQICQTDRQTREKITQSFEPSLLSTPESECSTHPIFQISLRVSQENVFNSARIFAFQLPKSASLKAENIRLSRKNFTLRFLEPKTLDSAERDGVYFAKRRLCNEGEESSRDYSPGMEPSIGIGHRICKAVPQIRR